MNQEFLAVVIHEMGHVVDLGLSSSGNKKSGISSKFRNGKLLFYKDDPSVQYFYPICFAIEDRLAYKKYDRHDFISQYAKKMYLKTLQKQ